MRQLLDQPFAYYEAMTTNIAKLAAWGKQTPRVSQVFDPPGYPPAFFLGTLKRVEHFQWFLREVATCLVPPEMRTLADAQSMLAWLPEVELCQTDVRAQWVASNGVRSSSLGYRLVLNQPPRFSPLSDP